MALKDELLNTFSKNPEIFFRGEQLAEEFHVSRAAVWKAVKALKSEGYEILSSPNRGYAFSKDNDFLNAEMIRSLEPDIQAPVYVFETIDSTNNYAKVLASNNAEHGTLVVANHQSAGRGRQGHTFYSPKNLGLYFSLIIRPDSMEHISRLTPAAAVAAGETIEEICGIRPGIKWVNDLFLEKKKIAGILCEAISEFETGHMSAVIVGIGINVRPMKFPDELSSIASSLNAASVNRNVLAACLRKHLLARTADLSDPELMELYRKDSVILGKEITYTLNNESFHGIAKEINDEGNMLVEKPDGSIQLLHSGEISVRDW